MKEPFNASQPVDEVHGRTDCDDSLKLTSEGFLPEPKRWIAGEGFMTEQAQLNGSWRFFYRTEQAEWPIASTHVIAWYMASTPYRMANSSTISWDTSSK